ncbi:alpha-L-fucosidase [uncultured Draconibacterium sp.]|uniref:alpha-L-fucosidase n=1 Tax=uncultured Draconibacterium sp. TaxID=1573823 RepID=UPI0029C80B6B|nr:alpha-L-fucosidase [uncultured Draconibacterium sp.]
MKRLILFLFNILVILIPLLAQDPANMVPDKNREARMEWWRDARFGLFIHWGIYSIPAGEWKGQTSKKDYAEWTMHNFKIPFEEYSQLAKEFNPTKFNADEWAQLAADAGMGYFVLTTKHHDGFAMFDSDVSDYNVVDATPFKRDVFGELATAFRKKGMKAGAYYSQDLDWSQSQGGALEGPYNLWDYPLEKPDYERFDQYMQNKSLPQVEELFTKYGEIGVVWFDIPRMVDAERGKIFHDLVRKLQPNVVINGRICNPQGAYADYLVPGDNGYYTSTQTFDWECCATMNESWGYTKNKKVNKTAHDIILVLLKSVSSGGNLLLNVGPKPDGTIPEDQIQILKEIAEWMKDNKEAIHGTQGNPFQEFFDFGYCTVKGTNIYLHVSEWEEGKTIIVPRLNNSVKKITVLGVPDRKLKWKQNDKDVAIVLKGKAVHPSATVIKLNCTGEQLNIDSPKIKESNGEIALEVDYAKSHGSRMRTLRHSIQDGTAVADMCQGHPTERLIWDFKVDKPGTFRVTAECLNLNTKKLTTRTVYLEIVGEEEYSAIVSEEYVNDGLINLGEIEIKNPGTVSMKLRVEGGQGNPVYLKSLNLSRK